MRNRPALFFLPALTALFITGSTLAQDAPAAAKPKTGPLAAALPSGAFVFAETSGMSELIAAVRDSDAVKTILESEQLKEFQATEEFEKTEAGRKLAEFILRMDLWEAGRKLFGGQMGVALYPKKDSEKPDAVFLIRPEDPEAWDKQRIWTDPLLALSAKRTQRLRWGWEVKVYQTKGQGGFPGFIALHDEWLAVATTRELLEKTISLQIDDPALRTRMRLKKVATLEKDAAYKKMKARVGGEHLARAFIDTKLISQAVGGRLGLPEKMDNPLASLIAGGIVELAAHSTLATITVDNDHNGLALEAALDGDSKKLPERYQVFFNDYPKSGTARLPEVPGLIGGFTIYRDIATWYRSRDALLQEQVLPGFDKFEAGIGNLLPGKDVGEDVLPLLGNNVTFVSALQGYDHVKGQPGVKLPAFAFVIDLDKVDEGSDIFQLFFQTLLSVLNFEAGKQERQPWLIDMKMHGDVKVSTARYLENPEGDRLPIVFNFLPASARIGDRYIVSSSLDLCENLIDAVQKPDYGKPVNENLGFHVRFGPLADILEANAEHFEAKRVGEGRTAKQAQADVAIFLSLLRNMKDFSATTSATKDGFKLRLTGTVNESK